MSPCLQQHWPFAGRRQTVRGGLSLLSACRLLSLLLLLLPVAAGCLLCEPAVAQDGLLIPQDSPAIAPVPDFVPPEPPGSASSEPPERTPDILEMPFSPQTPADIFAEPTPRLETAAPPQDVPRGYTGATGIRPSEQQQTLDFVPVEDRWRMGFPDKDRYRDGNPRGDDRFGELGHWWDPYNQNVLKGDYPIIGQHTFLNVTATNFMLHEFRKTPTGTSPFESTVGPGQQEFFGDPDQYFFINNFKLQLSLFHGDAGFRPFDWQIRMTPVFNLNYLDVEELAVVTPDVRSGTTRARGYAAMEEWFVETRLADLSPSYDFISVRAGSQPFVSDFRGFVFADTNRAVRLFGTRLSNRDQFNLIWFDQTEKDTNSTLNTFDDRHQNTLIANYFRQDFIFPGYTAMVSLHHNSDQPSVEYDRNKVLVRPDPAGVFRPHEVDAWYLGFAGDGHIGRFNISHAYYHVTGTDSLNPIQGERSQISADMAALELSVDRDWVRFRTSGFWSSGDDDPNDGQANGFDSVLDNPNFAGGQFSFWQRQQIRLFGVNLKQRESLVPNLRSSKFQGQSNFVNPGLRLLNGGMDFEITPKLRAITNVNFLWFDQTAILERFAYQDGIARSIGTDLSLGLEYRPLLSDNVLIAGGVSALLPGRGFDDLYGVTDPLAAAAGATGRAENLYGMFMDLVLTW